MGSFYTQILVRESNEARCAEVMHTFRRSSVIIPAHKGITVVCDKLSEDQSFDTLDSVAMTLSHKLNTPTVALLNNDDDWLGFRFFDKGEFVGSLLIGHTIFSLNGSINMLKRFINPNASTIKLYLVFIKPYLFQFRRHRDIAQILDLPARSVGMGYKYITTDDHPEDYDKSDFIKT
ncbi:hypothetical protein [uncultured Thiothrix sp.]|jgi:hypothetical protein|uniref:hypothetical protein n=1 Tax=uncultured Thiothrix sp. TaxID=223185 RepID=UPI0026239B3A|nr:hypothetical protein [uncultured Thiothrix sp.]HMT94157.1 hypothetical protein [Thiolinea sp.]